MPILKKEITPKELARHIEISVTADIPLLIHSSPALGKTEITGTTVRGITEPSTGSKYDLQPFLPYRDQTDISGFPVPQGEVMNWLPPEIFTREVPTVVLMDEINRGMPAVQNALMQVINERMAGTHKVPPHYRFIGCINDSDSGINRMSAAMNSRWRMHVWLKPSLPDWLEWAKGANVHHLVRAFLEYGKDDAKLYSPPSDPTESVWPNYRTWEGTSKILYSMESLGYWDRDTLYVAITGAIGTGVGSDFVNFIERASSLPSPRSILSDPLGSMIPSDIGMQYAVVTALAKVVTRETMPELIQYLERFQNPALPSLCLVEATARDSGLAATRAYGDWKISHQ